MPRFVFDIETNGLLDELTTVHALVLLDVDTGGVMLCGNAPGYPSIESGVRLLMSAAQIIGHNIIKFDIPALQKVFSWFSIDREKVFDTLVAARLIWSNIQDSDFQRVRNGKLPRGLIGSQSLEAWGYRLGNHKGDFKGPWDRWSQEMQDYCEQDVRVTADLFARIKAKNYSPEALKLEHEVSWLMAQQERNGFPFDVAGAGALYAKLVSKREELTAELRSRFHPWWVEIGEAIPKKTTCFKNPIQGDLTKDKPYTKVKLVEFNPASRDHIAFRLRAVYGWKPEEFTDNGKPKVDEGVLSKLPYPEAKLLSEYLLVQKRIGQLAEGSQAWLKVERGGRIHGSVNPNGAVTGRATHANPNIAQVPSVGSPYGYECRSLFYVPNGWKLVGADASGLELRCLAHFMAKYDGGAYAKILLEGDIHWANVQAMGLTKEERDETNKAHKVYRDGAKTFIYGFLYGAGDEKIGRIVFDIILRLKAQGLPYAGLLKTFFNGKETPTEDEFRKAGAKLKGKFLAGLPAIKRLREAVAAAAKRGYLWGLDRRKLHIRSDHAALNTLLQSAGALVCKKWVVLLDREFRARGLSHGWNGDYAFCAWVHDEVQIAVREELADEVGKIAVDCIRKAGEHFGFRCQLDGEYKLGNNWAETH